MRLNIKFDKTVFVLGTVMFISGFCFYGMLSALTPFFVSSKQSQLPISFSMVENFFVIVSIATLIGGLMSSRYLSLRLACVLGLMSYTVGYFLLMHYHNIQFIYLGLAFVATGFGLFEPSIYILFGMHYRNALEPQRDSGFIVLYIFHIAGQFLGVMLLTYLMLINPDGMFFVTGLFTLAGMIFFAYHYSFLKKLELSIQNKKIHTVVGITTSIGLIILLNYVLSHHNVTSLFQLSLLSMIVLLIFKLFKAEEAVRIKIYAVLFVLVVMSVGIICELQRYAGVIYFFKREYVNKTLFGLQFHPGSLYWITSILAFVIFPFIVRIRKKLTINGRDLTSGEFISIGLVMYSMSFAVLSLGIVFTHGPAISAIWLLLCYCFTTIGFLLVFPTTTSAVFGWSPDNWKGGMMAACFLAAGLNTYFNNETSKFISPAIKKFTLQNYNHIFFGFAIVVLAFAIFLYLVNEIRTKLTIYLENEKTRAEEAAFFGEVATQVAHDIRSPLLVLNHVLRDFSALPEKKRVDAKHAIERVTDIANNLLTQYKNRDSETHLSSEPVTMMLESIVSEKRIQAVSLNIDITLMIENIYDACVEVDIAGFKRVISNLINNAIDALKNKQGLITILVERCGGNISICIKDNGCGIPKEKVDIVLTGISFEKTEGSGLGLPYAIKKINQWRGTYSLRSEINIGTEFKMILPEAKPPEWFANTIHVTAGGSVVVLDDDDYIHQIWNARFPEHFLVGNNLSLFHCRNPQDFIQLCNEKYCENTTFLLDYDVGKNQPTGLALATQCHLGKNAILVTSRYEDHTIRENCKPLGIKIMPKYFAQHVPIIVAKSIP